MTDRPPRIVLEIPDEVVGRIAALAALEVEGVSGLAQGLVEGLGERLGRRAGPSGVRVEVVAGEVAVDVNVVVRLGTRIPEVAQAAQDHIKLVMEAMTGLSVTEVNIHVEGVERGDVRLRT